MATTFDLDSFLETSRKQVDAALDQALAMGPDGDPGRLREGMRYAVLQGGKRMRPMVIIAACEAVGGTLQDALPPCCALEFVHAYSLVHDDLPAMDNDVERRGKPTVHVAFGEGPAILIGDALLTAAFGCLVRSPSEAARRGMPRAVELLARHAGIDGMVGGQAMDIELGQSVGDLATLEKIHAGKTGGLYAASAALGGLYGGADEKTVSALERWGMCFGIAFQHADDMLDDDQAALREQALRRVEELCAECTAIATELGPRAAALVAIADWVNARAKRAAAGDRRD